MPNTMRILVVEDDGDLFESYSDAASEVSQEQGVNIELTNSPNVTDALDRINKNTYDGVIVDLNLDTTAPGTADGNTVIHNIYYKNQIPVKVISGNLQDITQEFSDNESTFLELHSRTDVSDKEVFESFLTLYKTGITKILGRRGKLEAMLSQVFWTHLASDIQGWSEEGTEEETLLRYTLSHLNEYLDRSASNYNDREFYIKPPIQKHISTGDIVNKDELYYMVLSPACDVAPRGEENGIPKINANKIILCPLIIVNRDSWIERKIIAQEDNLKSTRKTLEKIIKNQEPKYHFLPKHGSLMASVSDFQNIETCTINDYIQMKRIATVSTSFMKDIHSRFVAYIGRQGQPDLDKDALVNKHLNEIKP